MTKLILTLYIAGMFMLGAKKPDTPMPPNDDGASTGKGCYIATYMYGEDSPQVHYLRGVRDRGYC